MNKRITVTTLVALLVISALVISSCGSTKIKYPDGVKTIEYTDDYGRKVEIREDLNRIVATGPISQMVLYTIAPEKLVGLAEAPSTNNRKYFPDNYSSLPTLGQFYGKKMSLNLENLMSTDAEIIIDIGQYQDTGKKDLDEIQKKTGIATIFIEASIDSYDETYEKLGKLLGKEAEASELAAYCDETIMLSNIAKKQIKNSEKKTIYFGVNSTGLNANVEGNDHAAVIEMIGAKNAIKIKNEDEVVGKDGGNPVGLEKLYKVNPDVIVLGPDGPYDKLSEEGGQWSKLSAVKNGNYYESPTGPYSWMSAPACVNQILGIRWLGSLVYPEVFTNDIRSDAKEFYRLFWHYELSDEELDLMLSKSTNK